MTPTDLSEIGSMLNRAVNAICARLDALLAALTPPVDYSIPARNAARARTKEAAAPTEPVYAIDKDGRVIGMFDAVTDATPPEPTAEELLAFAWKRQGASEQQLIYPEPTAEELLAWLLEIKGVWVPEEGFTSIRMRLRDAYLRSRGQR